MTSLHTQGITLADIPLGSTVKVEVAGIVRTATFLGVSDRHGFRSAKVEYDYRGHVVRDLVFHPQVLEVDA